MKCENHKEGGLHLPRVEEHLMISLEIVSEREKLERKSWSSILVKFESV